MQYIPQMFNRIEVHKIKDKLNKHQSLSLNLRINKDQTQNILD